MSLMLFVCYLPDKNGTTVRRRYNVTMLMSLERRNLEKVSQNLLKRLNNKRARSFKRVVLLFQLLTNCPFGDYENHQNRFLFLNVNNMIMHLTERVENQT